MRRSTPYAGQCSHITIRCHNKAFLFNLEQNGEEILSWLCSLPLFFDINLHHYVIMSNHIHMLISPTKNNLANAMSYCLSNLAKFLNHCNNKVNQVFGARYCPTIIREESHLINVIRYIYQNPLRAGIVENIIDYKFSSLSFYMGLDNPRIQLHPDPITKASINSGADGYWNWLNNILQVLPDNDLKQVKQSMNRYIFRFSLRQLLVLTKNKTTLHI